MAKPNLNNNKKQNNDYFSKSIQQKGAGFIECKNALEIQRDAIKVFRDIARGNINFEKYGEYFLQDVFLSNLIIAANSKLISESIKRDGVNLLISQMSQTGANCDMQLIVLQDLINKTQAYQIILNNLTALQQSGDVNWLYTLSAQISSYKYDI